MNIILNKTYLFFFFLALITILIAFRKPNEVFDINIHDTYFVIKNSHLGILFFTIYFTLGIIHFYILKNEIQINKFIILTHLLITIGGSILIWFIIRHLNSNAPQTIEEIIKSVKINQFLSYFNILTVTLIFLTQFIFIITFIVKALNR